MADEMPLNIVDAQLLASALDPSHQRRERRNGAAGGIQIAGNAKHIPAAIDSHIENRLDLP